MGMEPFFNSRITVGEMEGAINLGIAYEGYSNIIATDILSPASFILSTIDAVELVHLNWGAQTSNPGILTIYGDSPTVNITDVGDLITFNNFREDIKTPSLVKFYENPVIVNHGTNPVLGPIQIGVVGQQGSGGDSIGGILSPAQKYIVTPGIFYIFEFVPEFDTTNIKMAMLQFAKNPKFNVGIQ